MNDKKFDWSQFTLKVPISAPVDQVYQMWTDSEKIKTWFLAEAKMNLKRGGDYSWQWYLGDKGEGKIIDCKKPQRFSFTFAHSKCVVSMKKDKKGSMVILKQYHIPKSEKGKKIHLTCNSGWSFYLTNLKTVLEYGIDLREKDPKYIAMGTVLY